MLDPASVRSDGRQPSFPSVCRPSRRAGCFLPSCDAPAFTGISVERAKRVKSEGPGISVEREKRVKRVKSEVRLACGWPAAVKHLRLACGWPAAGLRQSNMLEKLHKTQPPRRFQHTLYCTRTHTHTAPHTHPASPKQAAAYTHRIQIQYGRQGNTDRQGRGDIGVYWY